MSAILDKILQKTADELKIRKSNLPFEMLENKINLAYEPKDVISALKSSKDEPFRIIAEVKKASPSKGIIRDDFNYLQIAKDYELAGANAISVLTEPHFFMGNLDYLNEISKFSRIPLLRKDFIIDEYQILEALIYGADFVLLIAKVLSKERLKELYDFAKSLGLEVLFETHDKFDIEKANFANAKIIGINHRNLDTFDMDIELCKKLMPLISKDSIVVAESGIYEHKQLIELNKIGVSAFLIGEHFMRKADVKKALKEIKGEI